MNSAKIAQPPRFGPAEEAFSGCGELQGENGRIAGPPVDEGMRSTGIGYSHGLRCADEFQGCPQPFGERERRPGRVRVTGCGFCLWELLPWQDS